MAEKTTPFDHARETLTGYYTHGARNDAVDLDADARQLVIDMGHLIAAFHAERIEATAASGDLAARLDGIGRELRALSHHVGVRGGQVSNLAQRVEELAHRCTPAVEVATEAGEGSEQTWGALVALPDGETRTVKVGPAAFVIEHDETGSTAAGQTRRVPGGLEVGSPGTYTVNLAITGPVTPPAPAAPQASEAASGDVEYDETKWKLAFGAINRVRDETEQGRYINTATVAGNLLAALRDATPAVAVAVEVEVEVVSGVEAVDLPRGSRVLALNEDSGAPNVGTEVELADDDRLRVLDLPAAEDGGA